MLARLGARENQLKALSVSNAENIFLKALSRDSRAGRCALKHAPQSKFLRITRIDSCRGGATLVIFERGALRASQPSRWLVLTEQQWVYRFAQGLRGVSNFSE